MRVFLRFLFLGAALYDGALGLVFLVAPTVLFRAYEVTPPNHIGYVQFPALLLLLFAAMFLQVAFDPHRYRHLILYGCGLKLAYCGVALGHHFTRGIPDMWLPFAWADLAFLVLFVGAWILTGRPEGDGG